MVTSKFAVRGFTYALREDLLEADPDHHRRPGLVETNFSRVRFRGDEKKRVQYEDVEAMRPEDIAECVLFCATRPPHVNVDELVVKALAQSSGGRILRNWMAFTILEERRSASATTAGRRRRRDERFFAFDTRFLSRSG